MSKHTWAQEHLAAYALGGLEPVERQRLAAHTAQCTECGRDLDEIRALEQKLTPWLSDADPGPSLEDRMIQALPLRTGPGRSARISRKNGALLLIAATLLLVVIGAGANYLMEQNGIPDLGRALLPPERTRLVNNLKQTGLALHNTVGQVELKSASELAKEVQKRTIDLLESQAVELQKQPNAVLAGEATYGRIIAGATHHGGNVRFGPALDSSAKDQPAPSTPPAAAEGPRAATASGGIDTFARMVPANPPAAAPEFMPPATGVQLQNTANPYLGQMAGAGSGGRGFATNSGQVAATKGLEGKAAEVKGRYADNVQLPPLKLEYFKLGSLNDQAGKKEDPKGESVKDLFSDDKSRGEGAPKPNQAGKSESKKAEPGTPPPAASVPGPRKIIIRSGELEFEIDSFDNSVNTIMRLVSATRGGFVATINSDKLANGKVRGSVVVRVPPEQLDKFVLDLRKELGKTGELKNQRIGSEDISKKYTDLESGLRAARTMEERLLKIIKEGKGQIKDLLQAEKELGVYREKIEKLEGEIRYYNNLVSLATLTINLYEKEIRTAAAVIENERVQAGIEVDDVEKAHQEALKAIVAAKGRVTRSELKQHAAGQFTAVLHFEVAPEAAGPLRDRLKQLGTMVRLQIDRLQHTANGAPAPKDGKIEHGDTQFQITLYNLANITPRETVLLQIAVADVPAVYQKLREVLAKAKGHVLNAQLNEQDRQNISGQLDFDVRRLSLGEVQAALAGAGETLSRQVNRIPESDNVTDSKVMFNVKLVDADAIPPRESVVVKVAATDVPAAYQKLREAVAKLKARTLTAQMNEQDRRNVTAQFDFQFRRTDEDKVRAALAAAGETLSRQVTRLPQSANVTDAKVMYRVELLDADALPPRETVVLTIAAADVSAAYENIRAALLKARGRVANMHLNVNDQRNVSAQFAFDVRREAEDELQKVLANAGDVLTRQVARQQENNSVTDTRVGYSVSLTPAAALPPRETTTLALEVTDVAGTRAVFGAQVKEVQGQALEPLVSQNNGQVTAREVYEVPLAAAAGLVERFKTAGQVLVYHVTPNREAPSGKLARARIEVTLSNSPLLVTRDQGLWAQLRSGLAFSLRGLSISASWLLVGLLFVLPWVLVVYVAILLTRRWWRGGVDETPSLPTAGPIANPPAT